MMGERLRILHVVPRGLRGGIQSLIRLLVLESEYDNVLCTWHTPGPLNEELISLGHEVIDISGIDLWHTVRQLERVVREGSFDIVVNHGFGGKQSIIFAVADLGDCRLVQYLHSCYERRFVRRRWAQPLLNVFTRMAYRKADTTIAISEYVRCNHEAKFGKLVRPVVIYNGIDLSRFHVEGDIARPIREPARILYLGRLAEVKGVQVLIKSSSLLDAAGNSHKLTIAGWGDYELQLRRIAEELGVDAVFYGEAGTPEELYSQADIFVHPAIWQEGFGITLVEAMASGCICIASDVGGIPEVIEDSVSGFLCPKGDAAKLAEIIESILRLDSNSLCAIREASVNRALKFSSVVFVAQFDSLVGGLI